MTVRELLHIPSEIETELTLYPSILQRLLFNRGIITASDAELFLHPSYDKGSFDPFLMKGVQESIERIYKAVKNREKIAIYADYDCDGIPGAIILSDLFKKINYDNYIVYIPDRHLEGYGLKKEVLQKFSTETVKLIITIDLGITNIEEVAFAKELGLDIIITDHHLCLDVLPPADTIVNPKQNDCSYPDPMLCGSGVMFKIIQAFVSKYGSEFGINPGWEKWLLDLVGLATLSDMVPLQKENRVFAYYGMKVLRKSPRPGLRELFSINRLQMHRLEEDDITFTVSPRLNAAGRMDHPQRAFELLSSKNSAEAVVRAELLEELNTQRKSLTASITKHAQAKVEKVVHGDVLVLGDLNWNIGILGLVASKLVEKYGKTVFIWGGDEESGLLKGSCRSSSGVHLVKLMNAVPEGTFKSFGGHEQAGGFSVTKQEIHNLEKNLNEAYKKIPHNDEQKRDSYIDERLTLDDVTLENYNHIHQLAPFGVGNQKPIFLFENIELVSCKNFGKTKDHLELIFENSRREKIKVIQFFKTMSDIASDLSPGDRLSIVGAIEKSFLEEPQNYELGQKQLCVNKMGDTLKMHYKPAKL